MENIFNIIPGPDKDTCCILMYGEIGTWGVVTAQDMVTQILEADNKYKNIDIRINSVGGEVSAGIAIFNAIRAARANVTIYIDCMAASTASFIAGCGRKVKMGRYARIMLHRPTGGVYGNADELKDYIDQLQKIEDTLCDIYSNRTGMSVEDIRSKYMDGKDHWLSADEALKLGFVDEIFDDARNVSFEDCKDASQRCEKYTACYITDVLQKKENQMFETLKKLPAFSDCADEAAVLARFNDIEAKARMYDALKKENDTLKGQVKDYKDKEDKAKQDAVKAEVDAAILDGRIDETKRGAYEAMLMSDQAESAREILNSLKPARRASSVIIDTNKHKQPKTAAELMYEREQEVQAKLNNR